MNQEGKYGKLAMWYMPEGIANIILMSELEKQYRITYNSWEGHYVVYTGNRPVHLHKDEQGLTYINLATSDDRQHQCWCKLYVGTLRDLPRKRSRQRRQRDTYRA